MKKISIYIIGFLYAVRRTLFPEAVCRFYPSCSRYGILAIYKYGVLKGGLRALARLFRCNPFFKGGSETLE